jgi:hypothetical protein
MLYNLKPKTGLCYLILVLEHFIIIQRCFCALIALQNMQTTVDVNSDMSLRHKYILYTTCIKKDLKGSFKVKIEIVLLHYLNSLLISTLNESSVILKCRYKGLNGTE